MKGIRLIGLALMLVAALVTFLIRYPTKAETFIIYALIGIGITLMLVRSAESSKLNATIWNVTISLTGGVCLPFILFFTDPIGHFKDEALSTGVTVFVHGKGGRQDMILREQGYVIMDVGGERKKQSINENGQAFFQNLKVGDKVSLNIDFSEPYKSLFPDSSFTIPADGRIYLQVFLRGINSIRGNVIAGGKSGDPLPGVTVQYNELETQTNNRGHFILPVPDSLQKQSYRVRLSLAGYESLPVTIYPETDDEPVFELKPVKPRQ